MTSRRWPQVKRLGTAEALLARLDTLGISLPFTDPPAIEAVAEPVAVAGRRAPNRFAILPMEGWDGSDDGRPTDLVRRRWARFGASGAGMVWGGEAFAVSPDGRANPNQLCIGPSSADDLHELRSLLDEDQVTGLQLTHSGRWALTPRPGRREPLLDARRDGYGWTDLELDHLADDYAATATLARAAGFDFVDVKACHGYLQHELLGRVGPLEQRARFLQTTIERIRAQVPGLHIGVRLSVFDVVPHHPGVDGTGEPEAEPEGDETTAFGFVATDAPKLLELLDVDLMCVTAGSPYYCPHVQRPAYFPPSDGYQPPEDPLVGVARLVDAAVSLARAAPNATIVASGLSYLQEWVPHVASALVRDTGVALAGIGRLALSYPDLPADVLAGHTLDGRRLCRTFSDCTTAPRNGLVSGCWPLDDFYKTRPERVTLAAAKRRAAQERVSDRPVRTAAVVGLGIGIAHVRALRRLRDRFTLVAVCDPDESRSTPVAERTGADVLSFDALLQRDDIEIVHLCTPPSMHLHQCLAALTAGKHVVCEKPLVGSLADIDQLIDAEASSAGRLMPIFQYRFGNGLQQVKTLVDAGVAGRAYTSSVEVSWRRRAEYYAVPWRGRRHTEFGGVLLSQGMHALDMLTYIVGSPRRVYCRTTTRVNPIEVEDCAAASLEMHDGSLATISATLGSSEEISRHRFHFEAFSAESNTEAYSSSAKPWTITPDTPAASATIDATLAGWVDRPEEWEGQLLRFADALDAGADPPVTLAAARASLELLTALYWSARAGEDVIMPILASHPFYDSWIT